MRKTNAAVFAVSAAVIALLTVSASVWALYEYSVNAAQFTSAKWENAAPNERMQLVDSLLPLLNNGDSKTSVKKLLGTADAADGNILAYRLTSSPFSISKWLVLEFDGDDKLSGVTVETRGETD